LGGSAALSVALAFGAEDSLTAGAAVFAGAGAAGVGSGAALTPFAVLGAVITVGADTFGAVAAGAAGAAPGGGGNGALLTTPAGAGGGTAAAVTVGRLEASLWLGMSSICPGVSV
jgi:hypothetical protein